MASNSSATAATTTNTTTPATTTNTTMTAAGNSATFENNFFVEQEEVLNLISILSSSSSSSLFKKQDALSRLRTILDKYLECPTLLDPYLEIMVHRLSLPARTIVHDLFLSFQSHSSVEQHVHYDDDAADDDETKVNVTVTVDDHDDAVGDAVDTTISKDINQETPTTTTNHKLETLMHLFSAIYALSKVRGRKYIQRLLPHEASDVEPVLTMLRWFGWLESREWDTTTTATPATATAPPATTITTAAMEEESILPPRSVGMMQIPMAIQLFQKQQKSQRKEEDTEAKIWESVHSLLTWLGIISLVPFDLHTIDSSLEGNNNVDDTTTAVVVAAKSLTLPPPSTTAAAATITLVQSILSTSASHLGDSGATRETAAACLASLLSRPDMEQSELEGFIQWCLQMLYWFRTGAKWKKKDKEEDDSILLLGQVVGESNGCVNDDDDDDDDTNNHTNDTTTPTTANTTLLPMPNNDEPPTIFLIMGILQTLAAIFKSGHRSNLLSTQQKLRGIEALWEQSILVAEGSGSGGAMVLRKLLVKLFARVGCAYLPPKVAAWRYQRGKRSLVENLMRGSAVVSSTTTPTTTTATTATATATVADSTTNTITPEATTEGSGANDGSSDAELFSIPDQVEDAMDQLLRSLTDPSTIVRWSAAKGIGRLTERLPAICADDVLDALLQTCADPERDRAWHGACLALAELARRGLLLPQRLGEVVPIVVQAIGYDVRRGQHSVGTHVRDAACYTCWAFARAYAPSVLKPYVQDLSVALVLASLFDREVNCRRAASAAFQESVGRQGADNFKHGIAILTTADYYSLGNRSESFLNLSLDIAKFEEYQLPIIHHLSGVKLVHWDIDIRVLASKSLSRVSKLNPMHCANKVLPTLLDRCFSDDLVVRHGSLLGVAEMILALGELNLVQGNDTLSDETKSTIAELVPAIEKARLYRGRGGEIMRAAACRMIECISISHVPLSVKEQVRLLDSVDACLVHPNESIQNSAARALNALLTHYFPVGNKGPSARLQNRVVDKYVSIVKTEDNPAATRGFSLALGSLPAKLLSPCDIVLDNVLNCLCDASRKEATVGGEGDAETRRNSIKALVNVCKTVGIGTIPTAGMDDAPIKPLTKNQTQRVFDALLAAMDDYSTDRRGDVGSWSRVAAMNGLETLSYLSIDATNAFPHSSSRLVPISHPSKELSTNPVIATPSFFERRTCLVKVASKNANLSPASSLTHHYDECDNNFFDEELCLSIFSSLLKQLSEKLDAVRCEAGECIERLLNVESPRVPFVPCRDLLIKALDLNTPKNWSNPALTFPLLMCVVNIDGFIEPILSGIVISVGGLTESVSKSSSAALFEWIRSLRSARATSKINQMGEVFIGMFHHYKRNGRVILPLLSTLDKLLSHGYLDELLCNKDCAFLSDLLSSLSSEAKGCSDVKRLLAIVGVALNILQPHLESVMNMRDKILQFIMMMLLNQYPRVRCYTAEQLYVKLAEDGMALFDNSQRLDEANQLLLGVVWQEEHDPHGKISDSRNHIADLLEIELPAEERNTKVGKRLSSMRVKDEFASYSSLVNNAAA